MDSCKYELYNKELRFEEPNRCLSLVRKTVQLSGRFFFKVAGWTRLELATSCVTGRRSNQLNYHPLKFILCTRYELSVSCQ